MYIDTIQNLLGIMILERELIDHKTNAEDAENNEEPVIKKRRTTDDSNDVTIIESEKDDENTWIELARYITDDFC